LRLIGRDWPVERLQIATDDLSDPFSTSGMPVSAEIANAIFESRDEFTSIAEHIAGLATSAAKGGLHFDSVTTGYTGFYISLRDTGDVRAINTVLKARFDQLKYGLEDLKRYVRQEIEDNQQRATLAAARLAQKRHQFADELHSLTMQRVTAGLQPEADELWAIRDAVRAERECARLELEWKRNLFTVLALYGAQKLETSSIVAQAGASTGTKTTPLAALRNQPSVMVVATKSYVAPQPK
jgi:hypothetical protein